MGNKIIDFQRKFLWTFRFSQIPFILRLIEGIIYSQSKAASTFTRTMLHLVLHCLEDHFPCFFLVEAQVCFHVFMFSLVSGWNVKRKLGSGQLTVTLFRFQFPQTRVMVIELIANHMMQTAGEDKITNTKHKTCYN